MKYVDYIKAKMQQSIQKSQQLNEAMAVINILAGQKEQLPIQDDENNENEDNNN